MLYKFMLKGKQVNSAIADTEENAIKINGGIEYDKIEEEEFTLEKESFTPEKKTRKPRADKGQPRKSTLEKQLREDLNPKALKEKSRKKPEYFLIVNEKLYPSVLSHDEAQRYIEKDAQFSDVIRVIMGHEISFTRSVKFHF